MHIVRNRLVYYSLSAVLIIASLTAVSVWGLKLGIDFKGGTLLEATYTTGRPDIGLVRAEVEKLELGEFSIRPSGEQGVTLRARLVTESERESLERLLSLGGTAPVEVSKFASVGPILGVEAARKAAISIVLVMVAIIVFIAIAFRKVSKPISSWKYGFVAILSLTHDVIIPIGVYAALGHFFGYEVDTLFVTALLVILGFSVHDTIVVFDRVRENLAHARENGSKDSFEEIVGASVAQTFTRSINTSLTTILSLVALYFFGSEATRQFTLTLIIGMTVGTYSSIFFGSPFLVTLERWQARRLAKKA